MLGSILGIGSALLNFFASEDASSRQAKAQDAAYQAAEDQLNFHKQQYQDWERIFGTTEQHLADFYNNYTPEHAESLSLTKLADSYNSAKKTLLQTMSQRGLDTSGLTAQGLTDLEVNKANKAAEIRADAPLKAAQVQSSFLSLGLGQQGTVLNGVSNAYGSLANMETKLANQYGKQAAVAGNGLSDSLAALGQSLANQQIEKATGLSSTGLFN